MSSRERRTRRRDETRPAGGSGGTPLIRINSPLQLAFAILAFGMVICMVVSTCLAPF